MRPVRFFLAAGAILTFFLFSTGPALADQVHRVVPGETLQSIAGKYNTTVEKILAKNPFIDDPLVIVPYQVVVIPQSRPGTEYIVQTGDTLAAIAARHGVDPGVLADYNGLERKTVFPGLSLVIPPSPKVAAREAPGPAKPEAASNKPPGESNIFKLRPQFPDWLFLSGKRDQKLVALTFDDGPDDLYTPKILDILNQQGVKATFFLVGSSLKYYPAVVSQLAAGGHQLAWHGWTHTNYAIKTAEEVRGEMENTASAFRELAGLEPLMFRPPYGKLSAQAMDQLAGRDNITVGWSSDSLDWYSRSADRILANTLSDTKPGSIILMHSAGENLDSTVEALPELIYTLKAQGYRFVTVADLLGKPAYREENNALQEETVKPAPVN